jgi:hypothetical protein
VTGVSTGALTAPFAFLGSAYDVKLRAVYTDITADDVLEAHGLIYGAFFNDAMADTAPLRRTIAKYFDQPMLNAIAAEYRKGRILLIGTGSRRAPARHLEHRQDRRQRESSRAGAGARNPPCLRGGAGPFRP